MHSIDVYCVLYILIYIKGSKVLQTAVCVSRVYKGRVKIYNSTTPFIVYKLFIIQLFR